MQQIDFYCMKCKCSMKISYMPTGKPDTPVLNGIFMKCHRCKKVMTLKNYTEGQVVAQADSKGRIYR